jgi:hypothetical protein
MRALLNRFLKAFHPRPARRPARPAVETLEARTVPSAAAYRLGGTGSTSTFLATKWDQSSLGQSVTITYSFSNLTNGNLGGGLPAGTLKAVIHEALGRWAAVAPLRFVEVADSGPRPSRADYSAAGTPMIRFGHRPIDGRYNVLAYTYFPGPTGLAGDVTFDTAERWTLNPAGGTDLLEVATHEIGHALGLDHQPPAARNAIMNPQYGGRFHGLGTSFLLPDDVAGIRALYGSGVGSVTPLGSTPTTPPPVGGGTPQDPGFAVIGNTLYVRGTTHNDTFSYTGGAAPVIEINGAAYAGSLTGITTVRFEGGGGSDVLTLAGGPRAIVAAAGTGDRMVLTGTDGNDVFTASPAVTTLTSGPFQVTGVNFTAVTMYAGAGVDRAGLYDSALSDTLTATPTQAVLAGPGFSLTANGFDRVAALASGGGDRATLSGSAGDDVFVGLAAAAALRGHGYVNVARGFDDVSAAGGSGGADTAHLYDSPGDDVYHASPTEASLSGPGFDNTARGFDRTFGYSRNGGTDSATLYDSALDDVFTSGQRLGRMTGEGYLNRATGFASLFGRASRGHDRAVVRDGRGNDVLGGTGTGGYMLRARDSVQFDGFDEVVAASLFGGTNRRVTGALAFVLQVGGRWR